MSHSEEVLLDGSSQSALSVLPNRTPPTPQGEAQGRKQTVKAEAMTVESALKVQVDRVKQITTWLRQSFDRQAVAGLETQKCQSENTSNQILRKLLIRLLRLVSVVTAMSKVPKSVP